MTDINSPELDVAIEDGGSQILRDGFKAGEVVVVTGAARGFGRAISIRLAKEGAKLALWDKLEDEGKSAAEACRDLGSEVIFFSTDMSNPDAIKRSSENEIKDFGSVFAIINNAGIHPRSPAIDVPLEMWNQTLAVNLTVSFLTAQAFAKNMIGVSHQISFLSQLNSLSIVFPDIKRLGVIHDPNKKYPLTKQDIQKATKLGFTVIEKPLPNENSIPKTLRDIIPAIDGLVLVSDNTPLTQESFTFILKETLEHRIPLIGFSSLITQSGALCSIAHSPIDVGYTLAELAKKTFDQSSLPWGSTISVQQQTISLNTHTAEYLNIPITEKITNNADEIF